MLKFTSSTYNVYFPFQNSELTIRSVISVSEIFRPTSEYWLFHSAFQLSKDGTLTIEVAHKEIMSMLRENYQFLSSLNSQRIKVEAEVTESQTGRMQNSSSIVQFFDTPMKLRFVEEVAPDHFKPGLPYTIYVCICFFILFLFLFFPVSLSIFLSLSLPSTLCYHFLSLYLCLFVSLFVCLSDHLTVSVTLELLLPLFFSISPSISSFPFFLLSFAYFHHIFHFSSQEIVILSPKIISC